MSDESPPSRRDPQISGIAYTSRQLGRIHHEAPEELEHRLQQQRLDAQHARDERTATNKLLRRVVFLTVLFLLVAGCVAGWYAFIEDNVSETAQANAAAIVTTIIGGLVGAAAGYVAGRSQS